MWEEILWGWAGSLQWFCCLTVKKRSEPSPPYRWPNSETNAHLTVPSRPPWEAHSQNGHTGMLQVPPFLLQRPQCLCIPKGSLRLLQLADIIRLGEILWFWMVRRSSSKWAAVLPKYFSLLHVLAASRKEGKRERSAVTAATSSSRPQHNDDWRSCWYFQHNNVMNT